MLKQTLTEVIDALDNLQAVESHCINLKHEWTEFENDEYTKARAKYNSALINAMYEISAALKDFDQKK